MVINKDNDIYSNRKRVQEGGAVKNQTALTIANSNCILMAIHKTACILCTTQEKRHSQLDQT